MYVTTVIAAVADNSVYRKKIAARTMSVTAHIYAPYPTHIQLCTNIQTQAPCFPLALHRRKFRGGANKTTNFCQVENSIKTRHITFTHTNVYYVPNTRTCCIHTNNANSVHSRHFVGGKMACNSLCLPMHTDTHTTPYTFSKRKQQQTACGTYPIERIRQFLDCVHPRVSFILFLYCCNCYDYFRRS